MSGTYEVDVEKIKPHGMFCLVKRLPLDGVEEKTAGGLWIPQTAGERNIFCELIKVGSGEFRENGAHVPATILKPGDIVALRQYDGQPISRLQKEYLLVDGRKLEGARKDSPWPTATSAST